MKVVQRILTSKLRNNDGKHSTIYIRENQLESEIPRGKTRNNNKLFDVFMLKVLNLFELHR
jgi:hypothetical protein